MLVARASSSVVLLQNIEYGLSLTDERPYLSLKRLREAPARTTQAIGSDKTPRTQAPAKQNGKSKRALSISSDEEKPVVKKARTNGKATTTATTRTRPANFKQVISHTFFLQPYSVGDADANVKSLSAKGFDVRLEGRLLQSGKIEIGRLPLNDLLTQAFPRPVTRVKKPLDWTWLGTAQRLEADGLAKISTRFTAKPGKYDGEISYKTSTSSQKLVPIHIEFLVEVELDVSILLGDSLHKDQAACLNELVTYAFLRHSAKDVAVKEAEQLSGRKYSETDIDWFYASLRRPNQPLPKMDRKGKGRAIDLDPVANDGQRLIEVAGFNPILLPFQSRSLEWLLRREGKKIAGVDENGKHYVEPVPDDDEEAFSARRGVFWQRLVFEDGEEVWLNTVTLEVAEEDPGAAKQAAHYEGSIAAEEMGLGKTVELLALIMLNVEPERNKQPKYYIEALTNSVRPCGLTLLICPMAIVSQWQDEIERHAPTLRVLRYQGMKITFPNGDVNVVKQTIKNYDIVLCTFDIFTSEITYARKPIIHNTRGKVGLTDEEKVNYRRSLLVSLDFLRVVVDEAQMAASTTSAISETASLIPRKYSIAVSGTPIKQTIQDLAGLLKFLRIRDVGDNANYFRRLITPNFAAPFTRLVSTIATRTVKRDIQSELTLPPQTRFIVPVNFTAVEQFGYRNRYSDAVIALGLNTGTLDAIHADWTLEPASMTRWLHVLRQACFHARARVAQPRQGRKVIAQVSNAVQTLDEVLFNLRDKNIAELQGEQRTAASNRVQRAYRLMYDKEECERFEDALKLLEGARKDLRLLSEDIHNEMLLLMPETGKESPSSRRSDSNGPKAGPSFLDAFKETVKEAIEKAKEKENDSKQIGRRAGLLTTRLREVVLVLHQAVFFSGNAYFAMGNREEDEAAMYAEAEVLRKQVLASDEKQTMKAIDKMKVKLSAKPIKTEDVTIEFTDEEAGLQSRGLFEDIAELSEEANAVAGLMMRWRKFIIETLTSRLTDDEISAEEYHGKAETQEKLDIYIEYLTRIQNDWVQLVTGTKTALAETVAVGGRANPVEDGDFGAAAQGASTSAAPAPRPSRRSMYKKKAGMTSNQATAILAAADPAAKLRLELEQERAKVLPEERMENGESLRGKLRDLGQLKDRVHRQEEIEIITDESRRLRKLLAEKDKVIEQLRAESAVFADAYNARVNFFRLMQEFSDSVAELKPSDANPFALRKEMNSLKIKEASLERDMLGKIARRRFLDSLQEKNHQEEICLICNDDDNGQVVLTHCAHVFHEFCLNQWCAASMSRNCPVCRASLNRVGAWQKIILKRPTKAEEDEGRSGKMEVIPSDASKNRIEDLTENDSAEASTSKAVNGNAADEEGVQVDAPMDPSTKLNYLPPDEVEAIQDGVLTGAALGSKLDMITKHVIHLRERHQAAIELHDAGTTNLRQSENRSQKAVEPTPAKILIYSGWQYACDVLAQAFTREKIGFVRLESSGKGRKEQAVIEFKENPDVTVFILHAQSQAAGLNLTAAQYVILVEPLLQPALELQAIARVHRIGQRQATTVFQYAITQTVDERIALLSLEKKNHTLFARPELLAASSSAEEAKGEATPADLGSTAPVPASPRRKGLSKKRDNQEGSSSSLLAGEKVEDENDLVRVLLEKEHQENLQRILVRVGELKKDRAEREKTEEQRMIAEEERFRELTGRNLDDEDYEDYQGLRDEEGPRRAARVFNSPEEEEEEDEEDYAMPARRVGRGQIARRSVGARPVIENDGDEGMTIDIDSD